MKPLTTTPRAAVRRLATARLLSLAGTDASAIAIAFAIYAQTGSTVWLATSLVITIGLGSVLAPIGGAIGDRFDRKRVMVAAELGCAAVFATMAIFPTPEAMLGLSVIASGLGTLFGPAANAAIPAVAGYEELTRANALISMGSNVGKTVGRLLGGAGVALAGASAVFLADAVTFVASAALIASVRRPFEEERAEEPPNAGFIGGGFGFRYLVDEPALRAVMTAAMVGTLMTSFAMTAEVPLVHELGGGAIALGALGAGWTVGMIAGSWYGGRALHSRNELTGVLAGRLLMGFGLGAVALTTILHSAVLAYLLAGAGAGFMGVAAQSVLQRRAPDEVRARVMGAVDALRNVSFAVGALSAGFLVGAIGPQTTFAIVGIGVALGTLPLVGLLRDLGGPRSLRVPTPSAAS